MSERESKRFPDLSQFKEIIGTIQDMEDGPFRFRQEGGQNLQVSGRKTAGCIDAALDTESGDRVRMWWSNTSHRPGEDYPPDWPFIPGVDTMICEPVRDDSDLRVAMWTTDSPAEVVDEIVCQCVDVGWEHVSKSRALTKLRLGSVSRLISWWPFGLLKQQVTLFEKG